jgi:hypothetical protein
MDADPNGRMLASSPCLRQTRRLCSHLEWKLFRVHANLGDNTNDRKGATIWMDKEGAECYRLSFGSPNFFPSTRWEYPAAKVFMIILNPAPR